MSQVVFVDTPEQVIWLF